MCRRSLAVFLVFIWSLPAQEQLLREAARLDSEQNCAGAETYYDQALTKGPASPALLNNIGNHYVMCGEPERGRLYFEKLLEANLSHPNANMQMARLEMERKRWPAALRHLARLSTSDPAVRILRAEALCGAGDRATAIALLDAVEQNASGDARVLFTLGLTFARIGLYDKAETDFNAVLKQNPVDFDVLLNLGRAAARARHFDRAQNAFETALKLKPADVDALFELGLLQGARQDSSRAVYLLAQARQRAPQRPDIALALARAAEDAGYYGDSAIAYDDYLRLKPDDDAARRDRGRVYGYTGTRLAEGLKELDWYVNKHADDPIGFYDLAQFSWETDPNKALDQLSTALRLDPKLVAARYARAWLLRRLGRTAESVRDLQVAVGIDPKNVRALDQLGLAYLALDRPREAEKVLRQALVLSPKDSEVLLHLGRALMALGREAEAKTFLDAFQSVRPAKRRDPRKEPGMIELATMSADDRARRQIERLREDARIHPGDPELQFHLATLLLRERRVEEAADAFRDLLARGPESWMWEEAGNALLRGRQYSLARDFLQRAVAERPGARLNLATARFYADGPEMAMQVLADTPAAEQGGDFFLLKAWLLDAAGQASEAEKALQQGLKLSVSRPQIAEEAARVLVQRHRVAEALDLLARAVKANPDHADLLLLHAAVLGLSGRNSSAEQELRQIESRWPEWDSPYLVEGLAMEREKRFAEAIRKYETAIALGSEAARCGLARVSHVSSGGAECVCSGDLYRLLFACEGH